MKLSDELGATRHARDRLTRSIRHPEDTIGLVAPLLAELVAIREQIEELRADVGVIGEQVVAEPSGLAQPGPEDRDLIDEETRPTRRWDGSG